MILFSFSQLAGGNFEEARILQPLKFLHKLLLTSDPEQTYEIAHSLGLPQVLFDLLQAAVENPGFITVRLHGRIQIQRGLGAAAEIFADRFCSHLPIQQPASGPALGEMLVALRLYWEKHQDWAKDQQRWGCAGLSALNCIRVECVATDERCGPSQQTGAVDQNPVHHSPSARPAPPGSKSQCALSAAWTESNSCCTAPLVTPPALCSLL